MFGTKEMTQILTAEIAEDTEIEAETMASWVPNQSTRGKIKFVISSSQIPLRDRQ
jgi:hypothetical protein